MTILVGITSPIKSIHSDTVTVTGTLNITISPAVDLSKTFVIPSVSNGTAEYEIHDGDGTASIGTASASTSMNSVGGTVTLGLDSGTLSINANTGSASISSHSATVTMGASTGIVSISASAEMTSTTNLRITRGSDGGAVSNVVNPIMSYTVIETI